MAFAADVNLQFGFDAASRERVSATTANCGFLVIGVDAFFHGVSHQSVGMRGAGVVQQPQLGYLTPGDAALLCKRTFLNPGIAEGFPQRGAEVYEQSGIFHKGYCPKSGFFHVLPLFSSRYFDSRSG